MKNYTRREFLKRTFYVATGLGLLAADTKGNTRAETNKSILQTLEEKKQHYVRVLRLIETKNPETGCCNIAFVYTNVPRDSFTRNKQI